MPRLSTEAQVPPGTLQMLVLKALEAGPLHGYGILARIREGTCGALEVEEAALYPALHRMEARDLVEAEWGRSESNRKARFYRLTRAGRSALARDVAGWTATTRAIAR